jgi:hypothetical protein
MEGVRVRIPSVDGFALDADGFLPAPVGGNDLAVQDHMGQAVVLGPFQRGLAQTGGQVRQYGDELIQVAAGGGPRDAMVTGERIGAAVAELPQPQYRLPGTRQRPAAARRAPPAPLSQQQPGSRPRQFPGDIERGTIGDHAEPSGRSRSCGEISPARLCARIRPGIWTGKTSPAA